MFFPKSSIDPELDFRRPARRCNKVVLPTPDLPIINKFSFFFKLIS